MESRPQKLALVGWDAPITGHVLTFVREGILPNVAKLIARGIYAEHCLVPFPTITPPNWTTIVTGAWPGTHGITCFHVHKPGDPLDRIHFAFDSSDCHAEYLWNAAEKIGKRSVLVNYPSTWPPTVKNGVQVGGYGLSLNQWFYGFSDWPEAQLPLHPEILFSTEEYPRAKPLTWKKAATWKGTPASTRPPLEMSGEFLGRTLHVLAYASGQDGYDRVRLTWDRRENDAIADLSVGQWSDRIFAKFTLDTVESEGVFRCKLMELSPDAKSFRLFLTPICDVAHKTHPEDLWKELRTVDGLPTAGGTFGALAADWIDEETFFEMADAQHVYLAGVIKHLLTGKPWDLLFTHVHTPDWMYHSMMSAMDPLTGKDEAVRDRSWRVARGIYRSLDHMLGEILSVLDENTLVILVSDHGAVPSEAPFSSHEILKKAGLTVATPDAETGRDVIDWSKTKAVAQRSSYIYINLKGRDPGGIVELGNDYEQVRNEAIAALHAYVDPKTGKHPVALALKSEDAQIIGLRPPWIGDVVYAIHPEFGSEHGQQLPTAKYGTGDMRGLFVMAGPGVKKGYTLTRTMWLTDIVPTVCYLMALPVPAHAEGAILYQALDSPDGPSEESRTLRKNLERMERLISRQDALTHSYNR